MPLLTKQGCHRRKRYVKVPTMGIAATDNGTWSMNLFHYDGVYDVKTPFPTLLARLSFCFLIELEICLQTDHKFNVRLFIAQRKVCRQWTLLTTRNGNFGLLNKRQRPMAVRGRQSQ